MTRISEHLTRRLAGIAIAAAVLALGAASAQAQTVVYGTDRVGSIVNVTGGIIGCFDHWRINRLPDGINRTGAK